MPKTKDIKAEIAKNIAEAEQLAEKQLFIGSILLELETNRLIHEQNYQELASLIINNNKKLTNLEKKVDKMIENIIKLQDIWAESQAKKGFWSKVKEFLINNICLKLN